MRRTLSLLTAALLVVGCRGILYDSPTGERAVYFNVGFETKVDSIEIHASPTTRSVQVKGADSKTELLKQLLER